MSDGTNIPEIHPLGDALPERRMGAKGHEERLPAAKAECRLWVQKGDDRRNAPQRVKRADSRHLGNRELQPIAVIEARPTHLRQLGKQRLGFFEIRGVEAFGEPGVNRRQQVARLRAPPLFAPQSGEAQSAAQFPELGLLLLSDA